MSRLPAYSAGVMLLALAGRGASAQCIPGSSPGFDFSPGARVLFSTDFSGDKPGDFPAGLELKAGAIEVIRWEGKLALKASSPSALLIPLVESLPEQFTLEVEVVNRNTKQVGAHTLKIYGGRAALSDFATGSTRVNVGTVFWEVSGGGANSQGQMPEGTSDECVGQRMTVRLAMNGPRLKVYADGRRLASVPNAQFLRARGIILALEGRDPDDNAVYVTAIRLAGGAPLRTAAGVAVPATPTTPTSAATPASGTLTGTTTAKTAPVAQPVSGRPGAMTNTPLSAPSGVSAAYVGAGRFAIAWQPVAGAAEYEVYVNTAACPNCRVSIPPVTDTVYVPQAAFDYQGAVSVYVRALDGGGGVSPNSAPVALMPTPRHWGEYRVTVNSVRVNRETLDDPAQIDGKRDEIVVTASVQVYDPEGNSVGQGLAETKVHGDINAAAWSTANSPQLRIKAGSASALGGLRTGDVIAPSGAPTAISLPLLVWEGILREDGVTVEIVPLVWEVDRPPSWQYEPLGNPGLSFLMSVGKLASKRIRPVLASGGALTSSALEQLRQVSLSSPVKVAPLWAVQAALTKGYLASVPLITSYHIRSDTLEVLAAARSQAFSSLYQALGTMNLTSPVTAEIAGGLSQFYNTWAPTLLLLLNHMDRPIGISAAGGQTRLIPHIIKLDFESVEGLLAAGSLYSAGPGMIEVRYKDEIAGGNGDYSIFLKIERLR